ncbi:MAG: flagellar biosynthetic protein FliR [Armatimonadetes bacterium]|nr:flagellar biosynthetic protein FliR [Armatimonadota bacterium]MDW8027460.1 flagellar biosynthetic protein FliR [Armatimonadota bacterium]
MSMVTPEVWLNEWIRWLIAAARFGGAIALMPGLGSHQVPTLARATVAFGAALSGIASVPYVDLDNFALLALLLVREAAIGMLIGIAFAAFVWLVEWVSEIVDWQVGFGFSALVDPLLGTKSAIVSRAATLLAGVLFFQLEGHHWLIKTVALSYKLLPVGSSLAFKSQIGESWMDLFTVGLLTVLPFVIPAVGIVLLTDLVLGMMGRAAPQLSVLLWGMPARVGLAILVIAFSFTALPLLCEKLLRNIAISVPTLLGALR